MLFSKKNSDQLVALCRNNIYKINIHDEEKHQYAFDYINGQPALKDVAFSSDEAFLAITGYYFSYGKRTDLIQRSFVAILDKDLNLIDIKDVDRRGDYSVVLSADMKHLIITDLKSTYLYQIH